MAIKSDAQKKAVAKYNAANYEQILLRVKKGEAEKIKAQADAAGESLNAYIVGAVKSRMDGGQVPTCSTDSKQQAENTSGIDDTRRQSTAGMSSEAANEPVETPIPAGGVVIYLSPEQRIKAEKAAKRCGQSLDAWLADAVYRSLYGKHAVAILDNDIAALAIADAEVRHVTLDSFVSICVREYQRTESDKHKRAVEAAAQKNKGRKGSR